MQIPITSVQEVGSAIRALRKRARIRIDDFAATAGVSKQFMTDLENGKPTVQMGKVLALLQRMGMGVRIDLPDEALQAFRIEHEKTLARRARKGAVSRGA